MSEIIVTGGETDQPEEQAQGQPEGLVYNATEADEERFFLIYNMNIQPSEAENLQEDYRRWLIARFIHQKKMEQEMMQRQRLMQQIGPDLAGGPRPGSGLHLTR